MGNGRFKWITKPFKRWAFAKGVAFTERFSAKYVNKYLLKYLRKNAKSQSNVTMACRDGHHSSILLAHKITDVLVPGNNTRKSKDETRAELLDLLKHRLPSAPADPAPTPIRINRQQWAPLSPMQVIGSTKCLNPQTRQEFAEALTDYALGLGAAVDKNRGLDHSKVREYWIQRGPRLLATALLFFSFILICQETLRTNPVQDRLYSYAVNTVGLLIAIWMLYFRLVDSIEAGIARTAHDYYVEYKSRQNQSRAGEAYLAENDGAILQGRPEPLILDADDPEETRSADLSLEVTVHGTGDALHIDKDEFRLGPVPTRTPFRSASFDQVSRRDPSPGPQVPACGARDADTLV